MNNDLISREALKKAIEKAFDKADLSEYEACVCVCEIYDKEIDNAPTVEPCKDCEDCEDRRQAEYIRHGSSWHELQALRKFKEEHERPQGEWVAHEDMDEWYECNKCHCGNTYFDKLPNFCPNCGAKMKGGADNEI